MKTLLQILLILSLSTLTYMGNQELLNFNIFLIIILSIINKNYFSLLSIIPLFFINQEAIILFTIIWIFLSIVNIYVNNKVLKISSLFLISLVYFSYEFFINKQSLYPLVFLMILTIVILLINLSTVLDYKQLNLNALILFISIGNVEYINIYLFITVFCLLTLITNLSYNKNNFIFTSFFITIYSVFITQNIFYIIIQLLAYLGTLLIKHKTNELEFVLENINSKVTGFCAFLDQFSLMTQSGDYDKKVSSSIKILIESFCSNCKEKHICFSTKKIKTYIYLKSLLTNEKQINSKDGADNFFKCIYYFHMSEKSLQLQKQYNLVSNPSADDTKIYNICSSVQNYFISVFENITPQVSKLINFKKILIEQNISFDQFDYSIYNEYNFCFKIYSKQLDSIYDYSKIYFRKQNITIELRDNYVYIYPVKKIKIIYDFASLSLNNCQISGDNTLFKTVCDSNFICALSDGMGSGLYAYQLSQETIKMVDNITNCDISFDVALQILNNFFKMRDLSENYATLDLLNINQINGVLTLYKFGSSTTYISRGDKIIPIYNNNLPFGINDLITKEEFTVNDGDLIVLVSDGINDYISEEELLKYIETLKNESPHKIVYDILQKVYYSNNSQIKDDMSCVAIKIKNS